MCSLKELRSSLLIWPRMLFFSVIGQVICSSIPETGKVVAFKPTGLHVILKMKM